MPELVRFGPFELDLEAADLRRGGRTVRLPEQQFQILQMLLVEEGGVVTREDIRKRLWPNDTVVEFDRSINAAIMKLRITLGDTTDSPRFIETLSRRGYRLMVPVQREEAKPPEPPVREIRQSSLTGQKVSHYRVLGILGGGGMGLVYKGEDLKLNRPVALKFLPEELAADTLSLQRFEREARTASSLNHPNICTIYAVEEHDDQPFIAMELLEGESLRGLIARFALSADEALRHLPLGQFLDIATQIAEGLKAAHREGIVHRDIKPANIFVTSAGRVKILDFGLAKITESGAEATPDAAGEISTQDSPAPAPRGASIDLTLSRTGIAMGTAGYMSPEQVRGEKLDARTDLFSFGLILFEMATGQRAFTGDTAAIVQNAILYQLLPPARDLNPELPAALEEIIRKALEKDRNLRYGSVAEMLVALTSVRAETDARSDRNGQAMTEEQPPRKPRSALRWAAGALIILLLVGAAYFFATRQNRVSVLRVSSYEQITHDGKFRYLGGTDGSRIYFHQGDTGPLGQVATSGGVIASIAVPLTVPWLRDVSPDGSTLLVISHPGGQLPAYPLWTVRILGGSPRHVADGWGATWSPNGETIAYASANGDINLIRGDGTAEHKLASVGGELGYLSWSPDGGVIRFDKDRRLWEISSDGSNLHLLLPGWNTSSEQWMGRWASDGRYFFVSGGQIWALDGHDRLFGKRPAEPVQLTSGPIAWFSPIPSKDGKKIFATGATRRGQLLRFDAKSKQFQPVLDGVSAEFVSFSKDGKSVAYVSYPQGILWKANRDGSSPVQLSDPAMYPVTPRWSPDGKHILFVDLSQSSPEIYIVSSEGSSKPRRLVPADTGAESNPDWSPDGHEIVFSTNHESGSEPNCVLRILDLASHQLTTLPESVGMFQAAWSPDGRSIAAQSFDEFSIKVFDIPHQRWSLLHQGHAIAHAWSKDSQFVYFLMPFQDDPGVFRIRAAGGERERVVDLKGFQFTGVYGFNMSLDPTDAPLLLRDIGSNDIYALTLEQK